MILNVLLLAILCGLVIFSLKYTRKILFGTAFFILALLPVLKLVPFGDAFAADRYIYLPSIGIFYIFSVIVAGIVFQKALIIPDFIKKAVIGLIIVLVMALSILTWQRCQVWKNDGSLFLDVAKYYPDDPTVNNHLGLMHAKNRDFEKAIAYFKKGLSEKPSEEMKKILQWNLGGAYQEMNR